MVRKLKREKSGMRIIVSFLLMVGIKFRPVEHEYNC